RAGHDATSLSCDVLYYNSNTSQFPDESRVPGASLVQPCCHWRRLRDQKETAITTATVAMPPTTTEGTVPNHWAVTPDSTAPHWFEHEMKSALTAATRPRSASGVR